MTSLKANSQILESHPHYHGPIARTITGKDRKEIVLTLHKQDPSEREITNGIFCPPPVSWHLQENEACCGPLSLYSFLSVFSQNISELGNAHLHCIIEDPESLEKQPFIFRHPSGFYQLIHFDRKARTFSRQILYIIDDIATP